MLEFIAGAVVGFSVPVTIGIVGARYVATHKEEVLKIMMRKAMNSAKSKRSDMPAREMLP